MSITATLQKNSFSYWILPALVFFVLALIPFVTFAAAPSPETPFCSTKEAEMKCFKTILECDGNDETCKFRLAPDEYVPGAPPAPVSTELSSSDAQLQADADRRAAEGKKPFTLSGLLMDWLGDILLKPIVGLAYLVFWVASLFLGLMGKIMDLSIGTTLNSDLLGNLAFVRIGWTAVRDISNMFFIFGLLYIAILTILGLAGGGTKRWLAHLIIAAILINFSLFSTKVIIDAGNILGLEFWNKIKSQQGGGEIQSASAKILGGLDLQTAYKAQDVAGGKSTEAIVAYAGGAVFMFIAGYVLLVGALMMVTRTISLIMLMIFSPFAFMAFGLPKLEKYGHQWLDKLISQTFSAPFLVFMLYLNSVMVDKLDIFRLSQSKGESFSGALSGSGEYAIIFNFIMMIGFLISSIAIANSFAGETGKRAQGFAKKASGWMAGGTIAGGAMVGRQVGGRIGKMTMENEKLKMLAEKKGFMGGLAKIARRGGDSAQQATFDVRSTKMFSATAGAALESAGIKAGKAGGKGGYEATGSTEGRLLSSVGLSGLKLKYGTGYVGTDRVAEIKKQSETMKKRGFAPEEIERYAIDRAGTTRTKKRRRLTGYETMGNGEPDMSKPIYEVVGGNRISGYQHPAFKGVKANIAVDKAKRAVAQTEFDLNRMRDTYRVGMEREADGPVRPNSGNFRGVNVPSSPYSPQAEAAGAMGPHVENDAIISALAARLKRLKSPPINALEARKRRLKKIESEGKVEKLIKQLKEVGSDDEEKKTDKPDEATPPTSATPAADAGAHA